MYNIQACGITKTEYANVSCVWWTNSMWKGCKIAKAYLLSLDKMTLTLPFPGRVRDNVKDQKWKEVKNVFMSVIDTAVWMHHLDAN